MIRRFRYRFSMPHNGGAGLRTDFGYHDDFVQASKSDGFNNFCPCLVGYLSGKNWPFVIWLLVICDFLDQIGGYAV